MFLYYMSGFNQKKTILDASKRILDAYKNHWKVIGMPPRRDSKETAAINNLGHLKHQSRQFVEYWKPAKPHICHLLEATHLLIAARRAIMAHTFLTSSRP